jgi:hypothetical protein
VTVRLAGRAGREVDGELDRSSSSDGRDRLDDAVPSRGACSETDETAISQESA